jgi:hypothetical protein
MSKMARTIKVKQLKAGYNTLYKVFFFFKLYSHLQYNLCVLLSIYLIRWGWVNYCYPLTLISLPSQTIAPSFSNSEFEYTYKFLVLHLDTNNFLRSCYCYILQRVLKIVTI